MKKIGLSVCYDTKNFGSQLQVLATLKKVRELGYEAEVIIYKKKLTPVFVMQTMPRMFNPDFVKSKLRGRKKRAKIAAHPEIKKNVSIRNSRFNRFAEEKLLTESRRFSGWERLVKEANKRYDAFLCGSDQLWLPSNLGSHFYTLEFAADSKPKIAYATSFGVKEIPAYQKSRTKKYLERFNALSTREAAGADIIAALTGRKAEIVADPTLLYTGEEWSNYIGEAKEKREKYIFCYFLGTNEEHRKIANSIKKKTGYKIVTIPFLDNFVEQDMSFGDEALFDVDAFDFVRLIKNAEYVLTDSFHGSVFSILNHKKFMVLNRFSDLSKNSRNSRIDNLCSQLGLNNRRYNGNEDELFAGIDYEKVEKQLAGLRERSLEYLKNSLMSV